MTFDDQKAMAMAEEIAQQRAQRALEEFNTREKATELVKAIRETPERDIDDLIEFVGNMLLEAVAEQTKLLREKNVESVRAMNDLGSESAKTIGDLHAENVRLKQQVENAEKHTKAFASAADNERADRVAMRKLFDAEREKAEKHFFENYDLKAQLREERVVSDFRKREADETRAQLKQIGHELLNEQRAGGMLRDELSTVRNKLKKTEEKAEESFQRQLRMEAELTKLRASSKKTEGELVDCRNEITILVAKLKAAEDGIAVGIKAQVNYRDEITKLRMKLKAAEEDLDRGIKGYRDEIAVQRDQIAILRNKLRTAEIERDELKMAANAPEDHVIVSRRNWKRWTERDAQEDGTHGSNGKEKV